MIVFKRILSGLLGASILSISVGMLLTDTYEGIFGVFPGLVAGWLFTQYFLTGTLPTFLKKFDQK